MIAFLNGGMSGFTLSHSDLGGYTMITEPDMEYIRTKELLFRWTEMSTFSDAIMRSHPSNKPDVAH